MKDRRTEIEEAIRAADTALMHLEEAQDCLRSAGNWGVMDMLGSGFVATLVKRGKMGNAQEALERAKDAMRGFAHELRDVNEVASLHIELNDFLGFADYFFDGVIADWMTQSRIGKAKEQVASAIAQVQDVRGRLAGML